VLGPVDLATNADWPTIRRTVASEDFFASPAGNRAPNCRTDLDVVVSRDLGVGFFLQQPADFQIIMGADDRASGYAGQDFDIRSMSSSAMRARTPMWNSEARKPATRKRQTDFPIVAPRTAWVASPRMDSQRAIGFGIFAQVELLSDRQTDELASSCFRVPTVEDRAPSLRAPIACFPKAPEPEGASANVARNHQLSLTQAFLLLFREGGSSEMIFLTDRSSFVGMPVRSAGASSRSC